MKNLLIGALVALGLVACSAAAVRYVTEEQHALDIERLEDEHAYDVNQLQGVIGELEYRVLQLEFAVFGAPK